MTIRVAIEHHTRYRFDRPVGIEPWHVPGEEVPSGGPAGVRFRAWALHPTIDTSTWQPGSMGRTEGEYPRTLDPRRVAPGR